MGLKIQTIGAPYFESGRWRQDWQAVEEATGLVVARNRASFGDPRSPMKAAPAAGVVDDALGGVLAALESERARAEAEAAEAAAAAAYLAEQGVASAEELVQRCRAKKLNLKQLLKAEGKAVGV